ncbi:MAG: DUF1592 domain-containing protein [Myxococcota bacterium]
MTTISLRSRHPLVVPLCLLALALPACGDDGGANPSGTDSTGPDGPPTTGNDTAVDDTGTDTGSPLDIDVVPAPGGIRRLTPAQYVDSVEVMLGAAAAEAADPPPLPQLGSFDSETAVIEPLTPVDIEDYESSAMAIGTSLMSDSTQLAVVAPCINVSQDDACYEEIARELGRLAWRRPLTEDEVGTLTEIGLAGREWAEGDFMTGVKYEVAAVLESPNFLYVTAVGMPTGDDDIRELDAYELATRLSFFLVGHTPDLALLDLAEAGGLESDADIEALAYEMLDRPEARERLMAFYDELYRLRDLENKGKDNDLFPTFTPELANAMRQETQLLIQNVVFEEQSSFLNIFDATYTFVNDDLAQLYGMEPPAFPWQLVALPADQGRSGFLTQGAFLSVFSHPDVNSPTRRGLFVQEVLLCTDIQPPPPDVNPMPPTPTEGQTLREWMEQVHNADEGCASCHGVMDPVGFAFERFDPIGGHRQLDNGLPIDSSGDVAGLGTFGNAADLVQLLRNDPRTPNCVVRNLYRSTLGHHEGDAQAEGIAVLDTTFSETNYNYKAVMVELTLNPLFRLVDTPK